MVEEVGWSDGQLIGKVTEGIAPRDDEGWTVGNDRTEAKLAHARPSRRR